MIASSGDENGAFQMTRREMWRGTAAAAAISAAFLPSLLAAYAQAVGPSASGRPLSAGLRFVEKSGEELFANVCQGCHMGDGKGATGAGSYPSLADNDHLQAGGYPIAIVVNGQRGMPPFGAMMSDDQIAAVVNYVRTHFGNRYDDAVTPEDVRAARR
jgi:mono/diheme cytochrome c family protein